MLSIHLPPYIAFAVKALALVCGIAAALTAWQAARLWRQASATEMPPYDEPLASIGDVPELHIMGAVAQLNCTVLALQASGEINSCAARWAARSAILTGVTAILAAV